MLDNIYNALIQIGEQSEHIKQYFHEEHSWAQAGALGAFATINSMRVLAYIPQLVKAARDSNGATAISYTTWGLFAASNITTIIYALICLGDALMAIIFLGNAMACSAIVVVTYFKRRNHQARQALDKSSPSGTSAERYSVA